MFVEKDGYCRERRICAVERRFVCRKRGICAVGDIYIWVPIRAGIGHWKIGAVIIYGAMGAEYFLIAQPNVVLDRIHGPMWALRYFFTNFRANMDVRPFADAACRDLSLHYGNMVMDVQWDFT